MQTIPAISDLALYDLLRAALKEDIGDGDVTTSSIVGPEVRAKARLIAKSDLIVCGLRAAAACFKILDDESRFTAEIKDGDELKAGAELAAIEGRAAAMLTAERVALNLLQHLSGVATLTRAYVRAVSGTRARIAATRKTLPGLRGLDKYAVMVGGGIPHRTGLYDGVLIKDNHIAVAGGIKEAVRKVRDRVSHLLKVEVEAFNMYDVEEALAAGAEVIMLDNMPLQQMSEAVRLIGGRAVVEASGNVTLENVAQVAKTGVDIISVGALTHSARAADISMIIDTSQQSK